MKVNKNNKLLPCPFCGNTNIKTQSELSVDLMTQYNGKYVYCESCGTFKKVQRFSEWNNRAYPEAEIREWWSYNTGLPLTPERFRELMSILNKSL